MVEIWLRTSLECQLSAAAGSLTVWKMCADRPSYNVGHVKRTSGYVYKPKATDQALRGKVPSALLPILRKFSKHNRRTSAWRRLMTDLWKFRRFLGSRTSPHVWSSATKARRQCRARKKLHERRYLSAALPLNCPKACQIVLSRRMRAR
jgi:hypothetical protein